MSAQSDSELAEAFIARALSRQSLDAPTRDPDPSETLARALAEIICAAEEYWQPIRVPREVFVHYLADRVSVVDGSRLLANLQALHTHQLYLACACLTGNDAALRAFEDEFLPHVGRVLHGMDKSGTLGDEAKQLLRRRLFVSEQGRPPKIADYLGQGDLQRWVRATAVRLGIDLLRASQREDHGREDDAVLAALPAPEDDPELAHLKKLYGDELKAAFGEVLRALPSRERTILRYHYVDGLNIEQIGRIFQVHKTTSFRWLERARSAIVPATRKGLQRRLGIDRPELDSIMRLIRSQLDLSLQRLLTSSSDSDAS